MHNEPDSDEPEIDDVEGHLFVPPDERGGGHPNDRPREGRHEEPTA